MRVEIPGQCGATVKVSRDEWKWTHERVYCWHGHGTIADSQGTRVGEIDGFLVRGDLREWEFSQLRICDGFVKGWRTFLEPDSGGTFAVRREYRSSAQLGRDFEFVLFPQAVYVDNPAFRGRDLGLDAVKVYLEVLLRDNQRTYVPKQIHYTMRSFESHDDDDPYLRRHFERLHFLPVQREDEVCHYLSAERFGRGDFPPSPTTERLKYEIKRLRWLVSRERAQRRRPRAPAPEWFGALCLLARRLPDDVVRHALAFVCAKLPGRAEES